jgi:outer membrane lipoprotein-sorting protein
MSNGKWTFTLLALGAIIGSRAGAQAPGAAEIALKSNQAFYYAGSDMKARILMTLTSSGGQKRVREMVMLRRNEGGAGEQKYFIYFHQPADVKGMTFLVAKFPGKDDDRWLFLPAVNLVKRIAAKDAAQSFVGSDFTYEHVSGRDVEADSHQLLREEKVGERDCYVVESTTNSPAEYKRKVAWIDKTAFLPIKEEYYDAKNELFKVFAADEIQDLGGLPTIVRRSMVNKKTGHSTTVVFQDTAYNVGIEPDVFTERYLREPPRKWVQ